MWTHFLPKEIAEIKMYFCLFFKNNLLYSFEELLDTDIPFTKIANGYQLEKLWFGRFLLSRYKPIQTEIDGCFICYSLFVGLKIDCEPFDLCQLWCEILLHDWDGTLVE